MKTSVIIQCPFVICEAYDFIVGLTQIPYFHCYAVPYFLPCPVKFSRCTGKTARDPLVIYVIHRVV